MHSKVDDKVKYNATCPISGSKGVHGRFFKSSQVKFLLSTQIQNSPPLLPGAGSLRRRQNLNHVAHNPQKALADCGAASLCFAPWETPASSMARIDLATTSRIRNEEKKETKKIARGIFRSLAPLLGTAGSLSDCGIKPTIAELNFSRR